MPPTQNPQGNNQPNGSGPGQQPAQPQQYVPPQPEAAAPMMEPFDRNTNTTQPAYPPVPQNSNPYGQALQQPQYPPVQSGGAQPLRPYGQQFEQKEVVDDNPYDFFLNPQEAKKTKKSAVSSGGDGNGISMGKIVLVIGAMFTVVSIAAVVLFTSTKGSDPSPALIAIAKDQQEIIHVTTAAGTVLESQSLLNFAATARYTTTSAQLQYVEFLNKIGVKLKAKDLETAKFPEVDQVLTAAQTASTYDKTFKSEMDVILADYIAKLNQSRSASQTKAQSDILDKNIAEATLLQKQLAS